MTAGQVMNGAWKFIVWGMIVTALGTIIGLGVQLAGLQSLKRMEKGIVIIGEDVIENRRRIEVIDDTLRSRTVRFQVIADDIARAAIKIDTLAARVERIDGGR